MNQKKKKKTMVASVIVFFIYFLFKIKSTDTLNYEFFVNFIMKLLFYIKIYSKIDIVCKAKRNSYIILNICEDIIDITFQFALNLIVNYSLKICKLNDVRVGRVNLKNGNLGLTMSRSIGYLQNESMFSIQCY